MALVRCQPLLWAVDRSRVPEPGDFGDVRRGQIAAPAKGWAWMRATCSLKRAGVTNLKISGLCRFPTPVEPVGRSGVS